MLDTQTMCTQVPMVHWWVWCVVCWHYHSTVLLSKYACCVIVQVAAVIPPLADLEQLQTWLRKGLKGRLVSFSNRVFTFCASVLSSI